MTPPGGAYPWPVPRAGLALPLVAVLVGACAALPAPSASPPPSPTASVALTTPALTRSAPSSPSATPAPSRTPIPLSTPAASGALVGLPSAGCVNGWHSPLPGSPPYDEALAMIEARLGGNVPYAVEQMRYFTGPDVPWIAEPHYEVVERWYVKGARQGGGDAGRWLLEKRTEQIKGIAAVAPYDSAGYASPDWTGFVGEGPPTTYPGLPGSWSGIAYDFVTGENDSGNPGLPDEVADCLAGT
jgi:hypothetical protein